LDKADEEAGAAFIASVNAKVSDAENHAYEEQKAFLKRRAESAATFYAEELMAQKKYLDSIQAGLEFAYTRGNVSTADYYAQQAHLIKSATDNVKANLDKQMGAQFDVMQGVNGIPASREDQLAASAKITALFNQRTQAQYDADLK